MERQIVKALQDKGYRFISVIGRGSFSKVLRVWDERDCDLKACKISEYSLMAEREAAFLRKLEYPLFPRFVENWKQDELHYLVMEDIAGSNLREMVNRRKHFSGKQAVRIGIVLAKGFVYLHERSMPILFRDIKPDNIMVGQNGSIRLVDLGCACYKDTVESIGGSRSYGAPEQFLKGAVPGEESDVYGLGKVLLYLLTGEETAEIVEYRKGISPGLYQLLRLATQQEQYKRIPDMRTFLEQLLVFEKPTGGRQLLANLRALWERKTESDFYYVQNVRRGLGK